MKAEAATKNYRNKGYNLFNEDIMKLLPQLLTLVIVLVIARIESSAQTIPPVGTIPPGDSIIIVYDVTVNAGASSVSNQGSISGTNFITFSTNDPKTPAAGDATVTAVANSVTFSGKVFLQGAYNFISGNTMLNALNTLDILKTKANAQPYNVAPFNYAGAENVAQSFFAAHQNVVDWVLIQLRSAATPSTVVASRAAFVTQNGSLLDINGTSTSITFPSAAPGNYIVSIRHRNHLGVRTPAALNFASGTATYDFTTASNQSFQSRVYPATVQLGTLWAMRAGDANLTGNVKYSGPDNDQNQILNIKLGGLLSAVKTGEYAPEDLNMDGTVKWNGPDNDQNFLLNVILGGLLSTIYEEQL